MDILAKNLVLMSLHKQYEGVSGCFPHLLASIGWNFLVMWIKKMFIGEILIFGELSL